MFKILPKSVLSLSIISLFFLSSPSFAQEKTLEEKPVKPYKGSIEFGLKIVNGNSKEQSIYNKGDLEYKKMGLD
jgi:putative salt-induced outer membrane protein YdiY